MELQWPLILFTTFVAWAAGLFASQCVVALRGGMQKAQMAAWIVAAILLVIGCIAVFMHLQHWERIFNGFGHMSSGITQELIGIVLLIVIAVIFLVYLRKGKVPAWVSVVGIIIALGLVCVMGGSYMMAARPAWNGFSQMLSLIGAALALGPATMLILLEVCGDKDDEGAKADVKTMGLAAIAGTAVNAVTTLFFAFGMNGVAGKVESIKYTFDTTNPTAAPMDPTAVSAFAGAAGTPVILAIIAAVLALVCAIVGKKQGKWTLWGALTVIFALIAVIALRVAFFHMGVPMYSFF